MSTEITHFQYNEINKMIENLYDDEMPLHNRIVNLLHHLMGVVYFDKATILFFYMDEDGRYSKHSSISVNWEAEKEHVKKYDDFYCHEDDTLPIMDQKEPIVFKSSTFFNQDERKNNVYWTEYLIPSNCIYSIEGNLKLKNDTELKGGFSFYRGKEKQDFSNTEVAIIKILQPHISNVLKYYGNQADSTSILFQLENYSCVGLSVIDKNLDIVKSNDTFRSLITDKYKDANIECKVKDLCAQLTKSKEDAIEYKFDDEAMHLEIRKVPQDSYTQLGGGEFSCLLYDLSHFSSHTLNQAKEKYQLTDREFDIIKAVLKGKSNDEIAAELYLSLPTVKKYLASIYSKMEIKNQKQIFEKLKLL